MVSMVNGLTIASPYLSCVAGCKISGVADSQGDAALVLVVAGTAVVPAPRAALLAADVLTFSALALSCEVRSAHPPTIATATAHHPAFVTNLAILNSSSALLDV